MKQGHEQGLYEDIPFEEYKKIDAINNSRLTRLNECPAAALIKQEDTPSLSLGRAVHSLVLEGAETFNKEFVVCPPCDKRTKAGKDLFASFQVENLNKSIISADEIDKIKGIQAAVYSHPFAKTLLSDGKAEQTIIWDDEETGLKCKGRIDWLPAGSKGALVDLKTTRDASPKGFTRSCVDYGYAKQAGMYIDGVMKATGAIFDAFIFIAIEPEPPYRTEVYVMDVRFIQWGYTEYRRLINLEAKCRQEGFYPHYQEASATDLVIPGYLTK